MAEHLQYTNMETKTRPGDEHVTKRKLSQHASSFEMVRKK